jgi:hypothetical protein
MIQTKLDIEKEIDKHLPHQTFDDRIVYRNSSGAISGKRGNSSKSCRNPRQESFNRLGEIITVTPIIKKIQDSYFNEIIPEKYFIQDEPDKNKIILKKIQDKTQNHEKKLNILKVKKDESKPVLKTEIIKSFNRLQKSKYGKKVEPINLLNDPSEGFENTQEQTSRTNRAWNMVKSRERDKSFEEKLRFYQESPRMSQRRNLTQHFPWNNPKIPELPTTPENSKFYPVFMRKNTRKSTIIPRKPINKRVSMEISYLKDSELLGKEGFNLLLRILKDETRLYRASEAEIEKFNSILEKNISSKLKLSWKNGIKEYAMTKLFQQPAPSAEFLISEFFSQSC